MWRRGGFDASTLYRYWASNWLTGKDYNPVKQTSTAGGYVLRAAGNRIQVVGSFRNHGDPVRNRGKPYSISYGTDASSFRGKTYEFLVQELKIDLAGVTGTKILGCELIFVFEPDGKQYHGYWCRVLLFYNKERIINHVIDKWITTNYLTSS